MGENTSQKEEMIDTFFEPSHKIGTIKIHVEVKTTDRTSWTFETSTSTLTSEKTQDKNLF